MTTTTKEGRRITPDVPAICIEDGCSTLAQDGNWCESHYAMWQDGSIVDYYYKRVDKRRHDLSKYNLTAKQYGAMLDAQSGACAICPNPQPSPRNLAVDHDHRCCDGNFSCGKCVRGLLCTTCNIRIGLLEMEDGWLASALFYLGKYIPGNTTEMVI